MQHKPNCASYQACSVDHQGKPCPGYKQCDCGVLAGRELPMSELNELVAIMNKSKNKKLYFDFGNYCIQHPEERFWQALRNWAELPFLYVTKELLELPKDSPEAYDTFSWTEKNEIPKNVGPDEFNDMLKKEGKTI